MNYKHFFLFDHNSSSHLGPRNDTITMGDSSFGSVWSAMWDFCKEILNINFQIHFGDAVYSFTFWKIGIALILIYLACDVIGALLGRQQF